MMFSSRARALSEMALAVWAMQNDPWAVESPTADAVKALDLIQDVLDRPFHIGKLEKWLKESAEGRGAFV